MKEFPVPYQIQSGKCCVPCPYSKIGASGGVIMLGSASCRSCQHSGGGSGGEPVKCNYDTEVLHE